MEGAKKALFRRVLQVDESDQGLKTITSNTAIENWGLCASHCKHEECLSFSYTTTNQTCITYSKLLVEDRNATVSNSIIYFAKREACGVETITMADGTNLTVSYDRVTEDGPWIVIQRRTVGDVDFYRNWEDYKNGFGDLLGDFWIGNDNLHRLTSSPRTLRVELEAWDGTKGYAQYSTFQVENENDNYRLTVNGFSGNVYRAMHVHNGHYFTTYDKDNDLHDSNCAQLYHGAWWYNACHEVNLNGRYETNEGIKGPSSMTWLYFPREDEPFLPLRKVRMMIRKLNDEIVFSM
ncbi:ficolin-1-like [Argopecten irradians]|uniref:ficolin-1-like n=1 Tax=Argopecten irradians TaxID=31199 RepID=UPI0037106A6B